MKNDGKKYIIICGPQSLISQRGREGGREGERERGRERGPTCVDVDGGLAAAPQPQQTGGGGSQREAHLGHGQAVVPNSSTPLATSEGRERCAASRAASVRSTVVTPASLGEE
jgi:hypothetical protein